MLTQNEKQILGFMVDMGYLRGQERIDAGSDDALARELIGNFSAQMTAILPQQILALQSQKSAIETEISTAQELLGITTSYQE